MMKSCVEEELFLPNKVWDEPKPKEHFPFQTFDLDDHKTFQQESDAIDSRLNQFCTKLFHSDLSPRVYLFLFVANIVILLENLVFDESVFVCTLLEVVVTALFSLEVYINYVLYGQKYYKSFEGFVDTAMVTLCLLFILADGDLIHLFDMEAHRPRSSDYVEIAVCLLRLFTQSFRLARFYSRHRRTKALFGEYIALPIVNTA